MYCKVSTVKWWAGLTHTKLLTYNDQYKINNGAYGRSHSTSISRIHALLEALFFLRPKTMKIKEPDCSISEFLFFF